MEVLNIVSTKKTPDISFNPQSGEMLISGISCSENSLGFYDPVFDWINNYLSNPAEKTVLTLKLKYYNTSSAKCILELLDKFTSLKLNGKKILVNWHTEGDEEMQESGENFSAILDFEFNITE